MKKIANALQEMSKKLDNFQQEFERIYESDPHDVNRVLAGCKADVVKKIKSEFDNCFSHENTLFYPILNFGQGDIEVAEGVSQDAYAIIFGNCGGGIVGGNLKGHRHMTHEETLAILKFHNVGAIDVVIAALNRLRQRVLTEEPVDILDEQGRLIEVVKPILNGKTNDSP